MLRSLGIALVSVSATTVAAPPIDRSAPSAVTTVSREELEKLPVGRRLEDLLRTCPAQTIPTVARPSQPQSSTGFALNCIRPADVRLIEVYRAHNQLRAESGSRPLVWDPQLATNAAAHAAYIARIGQLLHASREGRGIERENLSQGLLGWNPQQMLGNWIREKRNFVPGEYPNVSRTGRWEDVSHYTQMIWPKTTHLGCGMATGSGHQWLVCRYSPGGNKDGVAIGFSPPRLALCAGPGGPMMCPGPGQEEGGGANQGGGANEQPGGAGQAPPAGPAQAGGQTRERPRPDPSLAPPNEGISRTTGDCGASVLASVKIIEMRDPQNPNKRRRIKESHNLAHGFSEIVIPHNWDADVDWAPDPNPEKTFPAPGTMTASWSVVGQPARRNATVTGGYGQLQKGWDREWGLVNINPAQRPTVQQHRIEAEWDPQPKTDPDKCTTDHDFTVTFAAQIPPPGQLDIKNFVDQARRAGFPGTRPRTRFTTQTRAFHTSPTQPFSRNNNVVVPIGIYWDLPENCCDIRDAKRKVIQFARAAIHGPNGRQGKGWGLDIHPDELERAQRELERNPNDVPNHDPTYTSNPRSDGAGELERGSGGGTRPNANDGSDLEQWDAPGMPKDLFDRLYAAQGSSVYRQQFLSLLVCRPPGKAPGRHRVGFYLDQAKICQIAITTVRWDFPGQQRDPPPGRVRGEPTISVSFDVRDGGCADLRAFLAANQLLDLFERPRKDGRNLEILSQGPYQQLENSVSNWETNPFADVRFP